MLDHSDSRRTAQMDMQAIAQDAKYLNKLPSSQMLRLTLAGRVVEFPGQSLILTEGSEIDEVFLIQRGLVAVSLYQGMSPSLWLYTTGPGAVVDMCALLDPPVSPVSVIALTDTEALAVPRDVFVEVIQQEPVLAFEILRNLGSRLALVNRVVLGEFLNEPPRPSRN